MHDWKVPWNAYQAQFEVAASRQGWSNAEEAYQLVRSLKGVVVQVLQHLTRPPTVIHQLDGGVTALFRASTTARRLPCPVEDQKAKGRASTITGVGGRNPGERGLSNGDGGHRQHVFFFSLFSFFFT